MASAGAYINDAVKGPSPEEWSKANGYRFHVLITKEDETSYSVIALNLPGVGSCGTSEAEALVNFREAAQGVLESYAGSGREIPWREASSDEIPLGSAHKWIIVDA